MCVHYCLIDCMRRCLPERCDSRITAACPFLCRLLTAQVPDFVGQYVKVADDNICKALKDKGRLVSKGSIVHSYPFCWRSDTPLIYRCGCKRACFCRDTWSRAFALAVVCACLS